MGKPVNRAKENTNTVGTGTLTLTGAVLQFQTFANAGLVTGDVISYVIEEGGTAWEVGTGTYTGGGSPTLTRNVTASSNSNALVSLGGSATVTCTLIAADLNFYLAASIAL